MKWMWTALNVYLISHIEPCKGKTKYCIKILAPSKNSTVPGYHFRIWGSFLTESSTTDQGGLIWCSSGMFPIEYQSESCLVTLNGLCAARDFIKTISAWIMTNNICRISRNVGKFSIQRLVCKPLTPPSNWHVRMPKCHTYCCRIHLHLSQYCSLIGRVVIRRSCLLDRYQQTRPYNFGFDVTPKRRILITLLVHTNPCILMNSFGILKPSTITNRPLGKPRNSETSTCTTLTTRTAPPGAVEPHLFMSLSKASTASHEEMQWLAWVFAMQTVQDGNSVATLPLRVATGPFRVHAGSWFFWLWYRTVPYKRFSAGPALMGMKPNLQMCISSRYWIFIWIFIQISHHAPFDTVLLERCLRVISWVLFHVVAVMSSTEAAS